MTFRARFQRLSLARQFILASFVVLLASGLTLASWASREIEEGVLHRTAAISSLYVDGVVSPHLQSLRWRTYLNADEYAALDRIVSQSRFGERIVSLKVWAPDGRIIYSRDRELVGQVFPIEGGLADAVRGGVTAHLSDLNDIENSLERRSYSQLLEVYIPVREESTREGSESQIIAVTEFYQLPDELLGEIAAARSRSWGIVAIITGTMFVLLTGIVKRGSDTIASQQRELQKKVGELSSLLGENAALTLRVRQAAQRTSALNEQALRRISADLHDGPGQALALGLLRIDALHEQNSRSGTECQDVVLVQRAMRDALDEIRAISSGLRLPGLQELTVADVAQRVTRDHARRGGAPVSLHLGPLPGDAPLAHKIALYRSIQEALSNATRHAEGAEVHVSVGCDSDELTLAVQDRGPGFDVAESGARGRLGLVGMRERAELLGGSFRVDSAPGRGTTVEIRWPMSEVSAND